jgi:hypothetical protein
MILVDVPRHCTQNASNERARAASSRDGVVERKRLLLVSDWSSYESKILPAALQSAAIRVARSAAALCLFQVFQVFRSSRLKTECVEWVDSKRNAEVAVTRTGKPLGPV